ncbi:polysaccharide pyruvyl transferase family protein [Marinobacter litoralis]|uniref:polysaccharide pyruvyl transferase family protein n=1 Tax=Marinobacter litoralis TaxID=187981 RepID=UPI0018EE4451|nr:polysaccharide pyruvyl transferase family protein [Marinobacter litoralis]MBJ6137330.1 polysaccharide pyruvyl transferase family protein [Marinobacter litoralis]
MKKVAILTQPLHDNYGGLLQAYALKTTIRSLGFNPIIVNRQAAKVNPIRRRLSKLKSFILNRQVNTSSKQIVTEDQKLLISENTIVFRSRYIPELTSLINTQRGMRELLNEGIGAYVVGSDQCWRPRYSPFMPNYFLDFVKNANDVTRISYAASFGVDKWEFTEKQTKEFKRLLAMFDAVSVREDDGVDLVREYLGRSDALHVIDPTMLLGAEAYRTLTEKAQVKSSTGNLKVYILDRSAQSDNFVQELSDYFALKPFEVMPEKRLVEEEVTDENVELFKYPCPTQWLKGFQDAEFVVTDSFHGTVFSILNNKPFIALGNERRGMSRFTSLLKMFDLQDRLVLNPSLERTKSLIDRDIDWLRVNSILDRERAKALNYLKENLER